jgi:flagellar biosynthesis/type III secretory pathway M-ring protein FliF/YscJ
VGTLTISYGHLMMANCDLVTMHSVQQQGTEIQDAQRQQIVKWHETDFWTSLFSYGAFILLGGLVIFFVVRALIQRARSAKYRKGAKSNKRRRK